MFGHHLGTWIRCLLDLSDRNDAPILLLTQCTYIIYGEVTMASSSKASNETTLSSDDMLKGEKGMGTLFLLN